MVRISYTGIDGKTTRFGAGSPNEAMARLRGIRGYSGGIVDAAAAGLAGGFAARRKNAQRVAAIRAADPASSLVGANGNAVASDGTQAARVRTLSGVRIDGSGNLVAEEREDYVTQGGKVARVGMAAERNLGKVKAEGAVDVEREKEGGASKVRVMVGARYDEGTHQLVAKMATVEAKDGVISLSDAGEEVITTAVEETVVY